MVSYCQHDSVTLTPDHGGILKTVLVAILFAFIYTIDVNAFAVEPETLTFSPCELELHGKAISRKAECATVQVPLSPSVDKTIELFVARLSARKKKPLLDPLLMLAGGPGQAASEAYLFADHQFSKIHQDRDIYLIDQRGTGRSTRFDCELPENEFALTPFDTEDTIQMSRSCLSAFEHDAKYFTTSAALADFEQVRRELGVDKWNILGVSYGTRVALHYMRMYPDSVRSVVLDSVLYPEHNLGVEIALQSQIALDSLLKRCKQQADCSEAFPELAAGVDQLIKSLRAKPVLVVYEDIRTGADVEIQFGLRHLSTVLRLSLYQDEISALLPLILHEAITKDNFAPLARKMADIETALGGMMSIGMHNSVVCTEDVPFYADESTWQQALPNTYLGDSITDALVAMCSVWPKGVIDKGFKAPVESDIPVLLFSGELDPITPPRYAELAMKRLSRSAHFVLNGQSHHVSATGCAPSLVASFIRELKPEELDASCLSRVQAAPFFIDFNGPTP